MGRARSLLNRVPAALQFLLAPVIATIAVLGYGGWRWLHTDWGTSLAADRKDHGYHLLGGATLVIAALITSTYGAAVVRAVKLRPYRALVVLALGLVAIAVSLAAWRDSALSTICACEGG
jgi:uncharacterized membrane protein YidH (DUF202 family)